MEQDLHQVRRMDSIEKDKSHLIIPDGPIEKPAIVRPVYQSIAIEIISILYFGALMAMLPIQQFYVIDEVAKKYGEDDGKSNVDHCPKSPVFSNSTSNIVQAESANILMYLGFVSTFIAIIPIVVFGSLTDRYGRKFYRHPLIMCIACPVLSLILTLTLLSETAKTNKKKDTRICTKSVMCACFDVYRNGNRKRNRKMLIGQMILCINAGALLGKSNVVTLFLLHKPLCWSGVHIQVFTCFQILVNWGAILVFITILHKYLADYTIVIGGTVSTIASSVILAISTEDWIVYLYAVIGIMAVSISPLLRSVLSRLVSPVEQEFYAVLCPKNQ